MTTAGNLGTPQEVNCVSEKITMSVAFGWGQETQSVELQGTEARGGPIP